MYARLLARPVDSCFLFGPRDTGESTWLHEHFGRARIYDLLSTREAVRLRREGPLLETLLIGELRAYLSYSKVRYPLHFWRSCDGVEVDLLCETNAGFVAVEVKAATRWEHRFNRGLLRIRDELGRDRVTCVGVYRGERPALWGDVQVLPVLDFLRRLWDGAVLW